MFIIVIYYLVYIVSLGRACTQSTCTQSRPSVVDAFVFLRGNPPPNLILNLLSLSLTARSTHAKHKFEASAKVSSQSHACWKMLVGSCSFVPRPAIGTTRLAINSNRKLFLQQLDLEVSKSSRVSCAHVRSEPVTR